MKKLVVFYSFTGNTRLIAENIAQAIGAELLELKPKNEPEKKFMKDLWCTKELLTKSKPDLLPFDKNLEDYDLIFIGTPIWAWTYASPLNAFFSKYPLSNKKIALFCCHGGSKGKFFDRIKKALDKNQIIAESDFIEPSRRNTETNIKKAKEWAQETVTRCLS